MCLGEGVDGKGWICRGRDGEELAFGAQTITWRPAMGSGGGSSHSLGQVEQWQCEDVTPVSVLR